MKHLARVLSVRKHTYRFRRCGAQDDRRSGLFRFVVWVDADNSMDFMVRSRSDEFLIFCQCAVQSR